MQITLRIKRVYLRAIADGSKRTEFRKDAPFYRALFERKPKRLLLHYQGDERLLVEVKEIRRILRPREFDAYDFLNTKYIYAIDLGRVLEHRR